MSAATVHGTGTTVFVQRPPLPKTKDGFYLRHRDGGLVAHITATQDTLSDLRRLARMALLFYGATSDHADTAQLVLSELVGNAVRACGEHDVPLVIEAYTTVDGVTVTVHDPVPELLPHRGTARWTATRPWAAGPAAAGPARPRLEHRVLADRQADPLQPRLKQHPRPDPALVWAASPLHTSPAGRPS
ncbi:hypothetical protein GXW82_43715 [Streptacidiphilus sp. 4-A2]|nr:hypothetical protein [Streptacidiphilus sp. 4-A2]